MYVQPSAATGTTLTAPTGQAAAFPSAMGQPQGDIYTSANGKENAKKELKNPMNWLTSFGLSGLFAWVMKNAGAKKGLVASAFVGVPLAMMGFQGLGAVADAKWDRSHPPNNAKDAMIHEAFRPSGLLDFLWLGIGAFTLKGNIAGIKKGGALGLLSGFDLLLLGAIGLSVFKRTQEAKEKFALSGRGQ